MTYIAKTRTDISKTKRLLETTGMRRVSGKTLLDKVRSEDIKRSCKEKDINKWAHQQTIEWSEEQN